MLARSVRVLAPDQAQQLAPLLWWVARCQGTQLALRALFSLTPALCYAIGAIIFMGFLINIPDFIAILLMREGAEMTEKGFYIRKDAGDGVAVISEKLQASVGARRKKMKLEFGIY